MNSGLSRRQITVVLAALIAIFAVAGILFYVLLNALGGRNPGVQAPLEAIKDYRYESLTASNGMKLHVLVAKPAHISLEVVSQNVTLTQKVGINGGFFYGESLISMGVMNGKAVNGPLSEYGSGGENMKYARGTLVWDGESNQLSVQVVSKASELKVKDSTRFWAQGGISMSLSDDDHWGEQAKLENAPFPDEPRLRSGAVYDQKGLLYLIVSETKGTLESFRSAIQEKLGDHMLVDGIFLDGDGSSQLLSKEKSLAGDHRPVLQMMRITK